MLPPVLMLRSSGSSPSPRNDATPEYSFLILVLLPCLMILSIGVALDIRAMRQQPKHTSARWLRGLLALVGLVLVGVSVGRVLK